MEDTRTLADREGTLLLADREGALSLADREGWAQDQFGEADLGDLRRTRRLVKVAGQMAQISSGSIPQQTGCGADMKAAYRLFAAEDVTHVDVCTPHWRHTREVAACLPRTYIVSDVCVLSYGRHLKTEGLSPIHKDGDRGLHQLNMLAVDPATKRPFGLAWQHHFRRELKPVGETREKRRRRPLAQRESHWWIEGIRAVGPAPAGRQWVHVIDRGGDVFEVYDATRRTDTAFIIRAAQDRRIEPTDADHRRIEPADADHRRLFDFARSRPARTTRAVIVRQENKPPRDAVIALSAATVTIRPPAQEPELRDHAPLRCGVVRAWEPHPPRGAEPLEWILLTTLPVETTTDAEAVVDGYAMRWLIEEFHKAEKTGCAVEARQLTHTDRLEPLIGLLSVLAVHLLMLKFVARDHPDAPAREHVDDATTAVMATYLKRPEAGMTMGQFWRGIARLGGHPGRKGDGPVGWLRAWRGWQAFQLILLGASLKAKFGGRKCG